MDIRNATVKVMSWMVKITEAKIWINEKTYGWFSPDDREIRIGPNAPASTPIHELAHAFEEVLGMSTDEKVSEQTITLVEAAIATFIKDNPEYCRALVDAIAGPTKKK